MTTFYGKQTGEANPTMRHEGGLAACASTPTLTGGQTGVAAPEIIGCIPRRKDIDAEEPA